jgi:hypothetical protein
VGRAKGAPLGESHFNDREFLDSDRQSIPRSNGNGTTLWEHLKAERRGQMAAYNRREEICTVLVAIVVGMSIFGYHIYVQVPEQNRGRNERFVRYGVRDFLSLILSAAERHAKTKGLEARLTHLAASASTWEQCLTTITHDFHEFRHFERFEIGQMVVFRVTESTNGVDEMWVAIPMVGGAENYLALGFISVSSGSVRRSEAVLFDSSINGRVFAKTLPTEEDVTDLFRATIQAHDWDQALAPDRMIWTHQYSVLEAFTQVGRVEPR